MGENISYSERILKIGSQEFLIKGDLYVVGGGKASGLMASEIERQIGKDNIKKGIVNTSSFAGSLKIDTKIIDNPLNDEECISRTKEMLSVTKNLSKEDVVLCLISGGGSALLPAPVSGVSMQDKQKLTQVLFEKGVPMSDIQKIRKHISLIKGGQLAKNCQPAKVVSLIISDLVDDDDVCASSPTEGDTSTFEEALGVVEKNNLEDKIPKSVLGYLNKGVRGEVSETPSGDEEFFHNVHNIILVDYKKILRSMNEKAVSLGYKTTALTAPVVGNMNDSVEKIIKNLDEISSKNEKPLAVIYVSEISNEVFGSGKGGRNQELTARLLSKLNDDKSWVHASIDSDGQDCLPGVGGAIIDSGLIEKMKIGGVNVAELVKTSNSHALHDDLDSLILMDPTGTNVGDIHVYLEK